MLGPCIAASYQESPDQAHRWTADGWFRTGDVASAEPAVGGPAMGLIGRFLVAGSDTRAEHHDLASGDTIQGSFNLGPHTAHIHKRHRPAQLGADFVFSVA